MKTRDAESEVTGRNRAEAQRGVGPTAPDPGRCTQRGSGTNLVPGYVPSGGDLGVSNLLD